MDTVFVVCDSNGDVMKVCRYEVRAAEICGEYQDWYYLEVLLDSSLVQRTEPANV